MGCVGVTCLRVNWVIMAKLLELDFNDTSGSGTAMDSVGITGEDGTFHGGATTDGSGSGVFDGTDDYLEVGTDPLFELAQGTISMNFTMDSLPGGNMPWGSPAGATLFSVDSDGNDDGGHLTVWIRSDGMLAVRHQDDTSSTTMYAGPVSAGVETTFEYEWSPTGSTLIMNGSMSSTSTPLTLSGHTEPIILGASQTSSGDGVADTVQAHFDGSIQHFALYDWPVADGVVACFVAGTLILTAAGPQPVETLEAGDLIVTRDHGLQPLLMRDTQCHNLGALQHNPKRQPIHLCSAAFGTGPVALSRQHCVAMETGGQTVLVRAGHLADYTELATAPKPVAKVAYHHLLLPQHAVIWANGIPCESLLPGPMVCKRLPSLGTFQPPENPAHPILSGADVRRLAAVNALRPCFWSKGNNSSKTPADPTLCTGFPI